MQEQPEDSIGEKMLYLEYIIVGKLPEMQRDYLMQNLAKDQVEQGNITVRTSECSRCSGKAEPELRSGRWKEENLCHFPPERSILISGDREELGIAAGLGFATLGFFPVEMEGDAASGAACEDRMAEWVDMPETSAGKGKADMDAEGFEEIGLKFLQHVYERHHHLPWTILETKRCIVKEFSMEYLDDLFALYAGEGMTDYIEPLYPYEQEKEYQRAYIAHMYGFYGYGMWIVCEKKTGKLIGRAGIEHREELGGELELGYAIGVPYQRQGYATEVCRAILDYAKEELESGTMNCLIEEGNVVSEHFAGTLGFSFAGILELDGKNMRKYTREL